MRDVDSLTTGDREESKLNIDDNHIIKNGV